MTAAFWNIHVRDNILETGPAKVTTAGDIVYATAANAMARLAIGAEGGKLGVNAGATAPEWMASPASDYIATQESTASTSFTDLASSGPAVTITTGTKALVVMTARATNSTADADTMMSFAVSSATTIAADEERSHIWDQDGTNSPPRYSAVIPLGLGGATGALTAGSNVFTAKYKVTAGTGTWNRREITVIPL